ncbi:MAG: redoxin domain-containing protein [Bacteroidia bacterium]|nr:redoxin domain-containing protein [Bacteroidia bacterium]MCZ2247270.1 redoxin domain-containing protein [Bacteroidia bacterium]
MALKKGDKAPNFKLFSSEKKEVSLDDFKGKNLIIHFFPAAFTGTCTTQLCTVRDAIGTYHNSKSEIVGISVDSLFSLAKYKEEQHLNFPLLSDFNKETSKSYQAYYDDFLFGMKGVSKRSAFVIDKDGIIQYAEVLENAADLPNFKAIDEVLEKL